MMLVRYITNIPTANPDAIGAGAIFQVIIILMKWLRDEGDKNLSSAPVASGFAVGMLVMYLTSILV